MKKNSKNSINPKTKLKNDPYFTLILDPAVTQMANKFGYADKFLENNKTKKLSKWNLFFWNVNTILLKSKNKLINRLIMPILFRFKLKK